MRIILASGSPRRRELLERFNIPGLEVIPASGEEKPHPELDPAGLVDVLAAAKAREVYEKNPDALVIGADTVVACSGEVLGKPKDVQDARRMLKMLSNRAHEVLTGVTIMSPIGGARGVEKTLVHFRWLSGREIDAYIASGEPMDKAGAYGIQGLASLFVDRIEGDYFNVVGLPLCLLGEMMKDLGVELL
jgi:septum formation protein